MAKVSKGMSNFLVASEKLNRLLLNCRNDIILKYKRKIQF